MKFQLLFLLLISSFVTLIAQKNPEAVKAYNEGVQAYKSESYKEAVQLYSKALKLEPTYTKAYYNRATAKMVLKDYIHAIKDLDKVIKKQPDNEKAYNKRAIAKMKNKDYEAAAIDFTSLLKLDEEHASAFLNRAICFIKLDNCTDAIPDLSSAINYKKNNVNAYYNRGSCLMKNKEFDKAILDFDKAIEIKSDFKAALINRGKAHFYNKNYEKALVDLLPLSEDKKYAGKTLYDIGRIYQKLEETSKSLEAFRSFIATNPTDKKKIKAYKKMAIISNEDEDYEELALAYEGLTKLEPDNKKYFLNLGLANYKQGDYEEAVGFFKSAIAIDDQYAEAFYNRANSYNQLGVDEAACADMKTAQSLGYKQADTYVAGWCK